MKKTTISHLAMVLLVGTAMAQSNYNHEAPDYNGTSTTLRAPSGISTYANLNAVMYIHPYELLPMNLATFTSVAFQYTAGTGGPSVPGNFTLYLQNTNDFEYAKGGTFTGALTGMSTAFTGTFGVPGGTGASTVTLPLTNTFNYTGGGLYVAWSWSSTGPFATNPATCATGNAFLGTTPTWIGSSSAASGAPSNTLTGSNFRPALLFNAVNNATTEVEVVDLIAPGKYPVKFNSPETITTKVVNSSIAAQNNVTIALTVVGANPYSSTQVIPNFAPGAITTLTWSGYTPTATGLSTITAAAIINDQDIGNNSKVWTQSVTCNSMTEIYPNANYVSGYGFTYTVGGIYAMKQSQPVPSTLTTISLATWTTASNTVPMYGVLADASGNILATSTNTPPISPNATVVFNFAPVALTANTDYLFGVAQTPSASAQCYPYAYVTNTTFIHQHYYTMPLAGGSASLWDPNLYLAIEPSFLFASANLTATASRTLFCKNHPANSLTLSVNGSMNTYTWTQGALTVGNGTSTPVTPTVSGASGQVFYTVIGTESLTGCKSNPAQITVSVSSCTGIESNNSGDYNLAVVPNPAINGKTTLQGLSGQNTIAVYNSIGQLVLSASNTEESFEIDISGQAAGTYLVKVTDLDTHAIRVIKILNQN